MTASRPRRAPARPRLRIAVIVETVAWTKRLPEAAAHVRRFARAAVAAALAGGAPRPPLSRPWALTVLLAGDAELRILNRDFRGKDKPTNVLSFPAWGASVVADAPRGRAMPVTLGDIALSYSTTAAESRSQGKSLADHLAHLTVHGVLHLFGYDHLNDSQADVMEGLERQVLARRGIDDPYEPRKRRPAAKARASRSVPSGGRRVKPARKRT